MEEINIRIYLIKNKNPLIKIKYQNLEIINFHFNYKSI